MNEQPLDPRVQPTNTPVPSQTVSAPQPQQPTSRVAQPIERTVLPTVSEPQSVPLSTDDYRASLQHSAQQHPMHDSNVLQWQASEYVEHQKSPSWFLGLWASAAALLVVAIFIMREYTFAALIVVMAAAIAIWAKRSAREMHYQLDSSALTVNGKRFTLDSFRAFGVLQEDAIYYAVLLPNKRFSPGVNVYFTHDLGERIVDMLGAALPMEDVKPDVIDNLSRRLNF